jgi:PAS domain S-box-containing protein
MNEKKSTILVVDDVPDDIVILEEILKGEYQVKAVTNGEAALKIARGENPPDLILLDIMMPGMDGFEVCQNLKENSGGATIPVIFLTAKVAPVDEKMGFELGAVDYIRKPVDPEMVKTRIRAHLDQKDQILRISEVKYRRLFETAQDGIMIVDTQTGRILDVNPSMATLLGLSQEGFLGMGIADFEFLKTIMSQQKRLSEAQKRKYVRYKDLPLATFDGRSIYVEFVSNAYRVNDREVLQLNIREITDLVEAEHERDIFSAKLSHYLATSPTVTYSFVLKEGAAQWQWVSENIGTILGYSSEEALAPDWWFRNVHSADRASALGIISDLSRGEMASREYQFVKKNRSVVWLHDEMRFLPVKGGVAEVVGTLTDISERKKAEEEIRLKSTALEAAANAVVITDREGVIQWVNPAFGELTGYSSAEAVGHRPKDLVLSGKQDASFYRVLWDTILSGKVWSGQLVNRRKSGELYDEEMTITPVLDEGRRVMSFIAIKNDITARVQAQVRLEAALHEKSALLREVHHRVNNNMQVIISLLHISSQDIADPSLRGKLEEITHRMYAMALIHEQFYQANDMSHIDFAVFLHQIIDSAKSEYPESAKRATVSCESGQALLSLEQAIPAGLIVAELLTNACKFAYPDGREAGTIRITQSFVEGGVLEVEVRDDGVGLPPSVDPALVESMGMMLVRILSEQLEGSVTFRNEGGAVAVLRFRVVSSSVS